MPKQKNKKSLFKRVKISSTGKMLRRHQMGAGHLKRHKGKSALDRQKKNTEYFQGQGKNLRKIIGL